MEFTDSNIIFLFSLPRSGSTLLQRILTSHPKVVTTSESWLLLQQLYLFEEADSCIAEYDHKTTTRAIKDFCDNLDGGEDAYKKFIAEFITKTFSCTMGSDKCMFFLEKTPRNNLIIKQIFELFPNSKFIFLWRNPLAVASSIVETFGQGSWKLQYYDIDLYKGLGNMVTAYKEHHDNVISVHYEDLIQKPADVCTKIFDYLQLPFDEEILSTFVNTNLSGSLGDKTGVKSYKDISKEPLQKWQATINNPIRKRWARNYLNWIGNERMELMGYSLDEVYSSLAQSPTSLTNIGEDLIRIPYGFVNTLFGMDALKNKLGKLFRGEKYYDFR